jgi:hypothetical protein
MDRSDGGKWERGRGRLPYGKGPHLRVLELERLAEDPSVLRAAVAVGLTVLVVESSPNSPPIGKARLDFQTALGRAMAAGRPGEDRG